MTMATVCAQAQSDVEAYFTTKEMPDMLKWCPAPPDTVGAHFTYDIMQYMWGWGPLHLRHHAVYVG